MTMMTQLAPTPLLAPGVYIDLPAEKYHSDPALGSTDIRSLHFRIRFKHRDTDATVLGTALHTLVLDGEPTFRRNYVRRPDTYDELDTAGKTKMTKSLKEGLASHQTLLSAEDWDLCYKSLDIVHSHPDLDGAMNGGLSEVSVFWERDGVRLKSRFDKLKINGIGDIKTIANEKRRNLELACLADIKSRRYDLQMALYLEARAQLPRFLKEGAIHFPGSFAPGVVGSPVDKILDYLKKVAAAPSAAFQMVFLQKTPPATVWSGVWSQQNEMLTVARDHVDAALRKFLEIRDDCAARGVPHEFYAEEGWSEIKPVREITIDDFPGGAFGWP